MNDPEAQELQRRSEAANAELEEMGRSVHPYEASRLGADADFADVRGQEAVKRAITIACAWSHNILMLSTV